VECLAELQLFGFAPDVITAGVGVHDAAARCQTDSESGRQDALEDWQHWDC
ncbi:MAG: hypothetical protein ACI9WU_005008, partial [Myxococcota bacterium]